MRTFNLFVLTAIALLAAGGTLIPRHALSNDKRTPGTVQNKVASPALDQGLQAYKRGDYKTAIRALERPAADGVFMAQYLLAQIYSDNSGTETDHAKAYAFYQAIAEEYSDVDPDDMRRAPFVARALTALAGYLMTGIPQYGVEPDHERAADYLHHAALFFGHEDAQFELVKLKLKGDGVPADIASAKHWLSVLSQRGHAGAQAFLADLYWRGKIMEKDPIRAMALIAVAIENAPSKERIWIEDVYQNIYCGAGEGVRKQASGIVAEWRTRYGRKPVSASSPGLAPLEASAAWSCRDGEPVARLPEPVTAGVPAPVTVPSIQSQLPPPPVPQPLPSQLTAKGFVADSLRETGVTR